MSAPASILAGKTGRVLVVIMGVGLAALLFWNADAPVPQHEGRLLPRVGASVPSRNLEATPAPTGAADSGPLIGTEAPTLRPETLQVSRLPSRQPELFPFKFLGSINVGAEPAVILYANGKVLTVRAPGPLDDDYAVDTIQDGYLIVRHIRLGESRVLQLTARQAVATEPGSPEDTPRD